MKLFGRSLSLRGMFRNQSTLWNPEEWLIRELLRNISASGIHVTPLRALGVSTVYACVNAIARTMSAMPLSVYRRLPNGGSEVDMAHPLNDLLNVEPNPDMIPASMRYAIQANAVLRNVGRALIVRNGLNEIVEIRPIDPKDLKVERPLIDGPIVYRLLDKVVPQTSLLEIKGLTFTGELPIDGMMAAREVVGLAVVLQDNASKFFANGSRPAGTLQHPSSLSKEAQDRLRQQIEEKHSGVEKAYNLLILEEGLQFVAQRADNTNSQFLESRLYQDKAIARYFGIPQHKVGILENAHFHNVEQENINYVTDCIVPWITQWEQEMNRKLLTKEERKIYFLRFNISALARGDLKSRSEAWAIWRRMGIINQNEWRAWENLNPVDGGDQYLVDQTLVPPGTLPSGGVPSTTVKPPTPTEPDPAPTPDEPQ